MNLEYKTEPREHQLSAAYAMLNLFGRGYPFGALRMGPGTGKTKVAIDLTSTLFMYGFVKRVLVIAPNNVDLQWCKEEIPKHCPVPYLAFLRENKKTKKYANAYSEFIASKEKALKFLCVNVDTFSKKNNLAEMVQYLKEDLSALVVDESTRIKSMSSARTKNIIYGLSNVVQINKVVSGVQPFADYRLILTGTITTNKVLDLFSQYNFLKYDYFRTSEAGFRNFYCIERYDSHENANYQYKRAITEKEFTYIKNALKTKDIHKVANSFSMSHDDVKFLANSDKLPKGKNLKDLKKKIDAVSYTITTDQALDLPEKINLTINYSLSSEQKKLLKALKEEYFIKYKDLELSLNTKAVLRIRILQILSGAVPYENTLTGKFSVTPLDTNPKLKALISDYSDISDNNIIVWTKFRHEPVYLKKEFNKLFPGKKVAVLDGSTEDSGKVIDNMKNGLVDIALINPKSGGIGLNLQEHFFIQYWFTNTDSVEDRIQAIHRCYRMHQKNNVIIKDFKTKDNDIEGKILQSFQKNKEVLDFFNNVQDFFT